jgi:hypothetical protein
MMLNELKGNELKGTRPIPFGTALAAAIPD